MDYKANPDQKYLFAQYTLVINRKPLFYVMLLIIPCLLCTLLVLVSFAIPPENDERVGFCATVFTSVSVYLLIMAELLPEKSDTLPILGIYYTITMSEIALVLTTTILILSAYHSAREPPAWLKALYRMCSCKPKRKNEVSVSRLFVKPNAVESEATTANRRDLDKLQVPAPVDPECEPAVLNNSEPAEYVEEDDNRKIWRATAITCDRIFFWVFLLIFIISTGYLIISSKAQVLRIKNFKLTDVG